MFFNRDTKKGIIESLNKAVLWSSEVSLYLALGRKNKGLERVKKS